MLKRQLLSYLGLERQEWTPEVGDSRFSDYAGDCKSHSQHM